MGTTQRGMAGEGTLANRVAYAQGELRRKGA